MRNSLLTAMALSLLAGCAGPTLKPPSEVIARLKHIHLVAMEPFPLGIQARFSTSYSPSARGSDPTSQALSAFSAIMMVLEVPIATNRAAERSSLIQAALDVPTSWVPTSELAKKAETLLIAGGLTADVAPSVQPIPGLEDRSYTFTMENWLGPIRDWYDAPDSPFDYRALARNDATLVMEVGISSYMFGEEMLLQVHLKLVDPASGQMVGRASATNYFDRAKVGPCAQPSPEIAAHIKEVFRQEGTRLLQKSLRELGVLR